MDAQATRAALFLLVAPGSLAEVGSQNVPILAYLSPATFVLGSLAYGVPALVIREVAAARGLNAAGLAILGLAYGILNEGVLARTLTQASAAPLLADHRHRGSVTAPRCLPRLPAGSPARSPG